MYTPIYIITPWEGDFARDLYYIRAAYRFTLRQGYVPISDTLFKMEGVLVLEDETEFEVFEKAQNTLIDTALVTEGVPPVWVFTDYGITSSMKKLINRCKEARIPHRKIRMWSA